MSASRVRAGVSPMVAMLILLVVAVAAGILVYAWLSGWMGWRLYEAGVRIKVDDVTVGDGRVRVVVRNTGSFKARITRAFVDELEYEAFTELEPGDYVELAFPYAWTYRRGIKVEVLTDTGYSAKWEAPIRVPEVPFALEFDGAGDDYISTPHADDLSLTTFTIECWVKLISPATTDVPIAVKGGGTSDTCNYGLFFYKRTALGDADARRVEVAFRTGAPGPRRYTYTLTRLETDRWYHVVGLFDGAQLRIYLNGELENTRDTTDTPATNTDPLYVGYNGYAPYRASRTFVIDELRIYNRPLTEDEIRANIHGKIATDGLVLWYRFDEGTGTSVEDVSGAGHTATFGSPAPSWTDGVKKADVEGVIAAVPLPALDLGLLTTLVEETLSCARPSSDRRRWP